MAMFSGDSVTLVNRTKGVLHVKFDGRDWPIRPGKNTGFPKEMIKHAKTQNPIMGTEDLYHPTRFKSLVGVEGVDDCSPMEQSKAVERIDRKTVQGRGSKAKPIKGDPVSAFEARVAAIDEDGDGRIDGEAAAAQ